MNAIHSLTNGLFCGLLLCLAFDRAMTKPSLRAPKEVPLDPAEWGPMWRTGDPGARWRIAHTDSFRKSLLGRPREEIRALLGPPLESCDEHDLWIIGPVHGGPLDSEFNPRWYGFAVVFDGREVAVWGGWSHGGVVSLPSGIAERLDTEPAEDAENAFSGKNGTEDAE